MKAEKQTKKQKKPVRKTNFSQQVITTILVLLAIGFLYSSLSGKTTESSEITLSQVAEMVTAGQVANIVVKGDTLTITAKDETKKTAKKEAGASLPETLATYGVTGEVLRTTPITVKTESNAWIIILNIFSILAPILFIGFFFWYMNRQMAGAAGGGKHSHSDNQRRVLQIQMGKIKKLRLQMLQEISKQSKSFLML
jgi:ATP-dependent Zn protease